MTIPITKKITYAGFSARVYKAALDDNRIILLGMVGHQNAMRAIWARMMEKASSTSWIGDITMEGQASLWLRNDGYTRFEKSIALGDGRKLFQMIVASKTLLGLSIDKPVYMINDKDEMPPEFWGRLVMRVEIPFQDGKAEAYWQSATNPKQVKLGTSLVKPIETHNCFAWSLTDDEERWQKVITDTYKASQS